MSDRQHCRSCGWNAIGKIHSRFRPAELGLAGLLTIVLVFIGLLLIGCLVNCLKNGSTNNQEVKAMKIEMKKIIADTAIATLENVWAVGTNFLAGALLA